MKKASNAVTELSLGFLCNWHAACSASLSHKHTHTHTRAVSSKPIANVKVCLLFNEAQKKKTENMSLGGKKK